MSSNPIVVGVDGSDRNRAAVLWAAAEAARSGADLVLATVVEDLPSSAKSRGLADKHALAALDIAGEVRTLVPEEQVETRVLTGRPERELPTAFPDARLLVVGKRGLGAIPRLLVGSTSLALAGRSEVPVVIVPKGWEQDRHADQPMILGIDPERPNVRLIEVAAHRAQERNVPLVVVHGWETPSVYSAPESAAEAAEQERRSHERFDRLMDEWEKRYPEVDLRRISSHDHPAMAVLEASKHAQLVILGRRSSSRIAGFAFGSVTRAVLHYSEPPVLVVPTED